MSRFKIIYILSLVILGLLIAFTVFQPMAVGGNTVRCSGSTYFK